jgi:predicted pyridoxine 5'-phosphate oxidase superfamily flavin-nucleotide-binding protein
MSLPGSDVFHAGEIAVQERAGERTVAVRRATMIRDRLDDGMRAFLETQGVAAVGGMDEDGALWASLWCGTPGFLRGDHGGGRLALLAGRDIPVADDPVRKAIRERTDLGVLVIDFMARRRLRINGSIVYAADAGLELGVREVFGNCAKYIQRRLRTDDVTSEVKEAVPAPVERGSRLDDARRDMVRRADTAFVATVHPGRGLDVSHRGGEPGFVRIADDNYLRIPDYPGNSMFQTFGNLDIDARAGMAVVDFDRRRVLSLTGRAVTVFGAEDPEHPAGGTGRYWSFSVAGWVEYSLPAAMTWTLLERSPSNPPA